MEPYSADDIKRRGEKSFITGRNIYLKILIWGIHDSGKTAYLDILYKMSQDEDLDIRPTGPINKISRADGSTLYFDRGIFQSKAYQDVYYQIYTVAGGLRFSPLRKKIFKGSDGIIFIVDARTGKLEENVKILQELKSLSRGQLIKTIPLIILLNNRVLEDCITKEDFIQILRNEDLWHGSNDELSQWNPEIYETVLTYEQRAVLYNCLLECIRRIAIYRGGDFYTYPYIFKPPEPPDDIGVATNMQRKKPVEEENSEVELFCRYCGSKLAMDERFCSVCGKKS